MTFPWLKVLDLEEEFQVVITDAKRKGKKDGQGKLTARGRVARVCLVCIMYSAVNTVVVT